MVRVDFKVTHNSPIAMKQSLLLCQILIASPSMLMAQGSLAFDTTPLDSNTSTARKVEQVRTNKFALAPDHVFYDAPGDGQLWARGASYKASFGAHGATYIPFLGSDAPKNYPVRMQLMSATLGGKPMQLTEDATWSRDGDSVTLERGDVDVRYHLGLEQIEQTFVIDSLPADGDLLVRIAVDSELEGETRSNGFRFSGSRGGVNYGTATVLDANGRSLAIESRLEAGEIQIEVPEGFLRSARLPVIVDPLITTYVIADTNTNTSRGGVAYDKTYQRALHAFGFDFSQNDKDVFSVTVNADGSHNPLDAAWIDVTSANWQSVSVANNNDENTFLVAANVMEANVTQVWTRLRQLPGSAMGAARKINVGDNFCGVPSVGGDGNEGAGSLYCVAWGENLDNTGLTAINYRMVSSIGSIASTVHQIDNGNHPLTPHVSISKSNGSGVLINRVWNVVWDNYVAEANSNIEGAQIAFNGNIVTPSFTVDSTPTSHFQPSVSAPLRSAAGGAADYLVVYATGTLLDQDIHARMFKRDNYIASFDITSIEAAELGAQHLNGNQRHPEVATDGDQFLVGYNYRPTGGSGDYEVYISSFAHMDDELFLTETHKAISSGTGSHLAPTLATAADSGDVGSRSVFIAYQERILENGMPVDYNTLGAVYQTPSGWSSVGTALCGGNTNSTGARATMRAFGYAHPIFNQFYLDVDNLPAFQWGMFLMSQTQTSLPVGNGTLCLGGPQIRLQSTLENSWIRGAAGSQLDLTALPANTSIQPGQAWNFQFWFRDSGSSNFSNAITVNF